MEVELGEWRVDLVFLFLYFSSSVVTNGDVDFFLQGNHVQACGIRYVYTAFES